MKKLLLLSLLLIAIGFVSIAQPNYSVSLISKNLLPYASAVIRSKETTIEVKSMDNTVYRIKEAITVLNKNGDDLARIVVWHNKSNVIKSIKGIVYNEFSQPVSNFSESNFSDVNASSDFSLFEDSRVKHFVPVVLSYPYTIEYEYEVRSKQSLTFNDWKPVNGTGLAVEKSSFTFICKDDYNVRFKEINMPAPAVATQDKNIKSYKWTVNNLPANKDEPYSPNPDSYESCVKIAPENFMYEGLTGSFTNWNDLGQWIYDKLLVSRGELPSSTVDFIKTLTKDITDPKQKARKIYEYMQQKTRYISVQIGIGGYQPFLASDVDKESYGDCKALVNYMQALLKAVDIESYYCVVEAGENKTSMLPDFASMDQGNHVILCMPLKGDTTWLECTNQKIPFGYLGDFTDDRMVLACTPKGGLLLHTPKYTTSNNLQTRTASFTINEAGQLTGDIETVFKGLQYDNRESLIDESPVEQMKALKHIYPINNMDIEHFKVQQNKNNEPTTTENIKLTARDYASAEQDKINFLLNPINRTAQAPRELHNRLKPVFIGDGYTDIDDITFTIPTNYRLDRTPLAIAIDKPFGSYQAHMVLNGNKIVYKRRLQLIDGTYDKNSYQDLVDFYKAVADADNYSISLIKKSN
jgi:transglutaminase-like putative cysteine protease